MRLALGPAGPAARLGDPVGSRSGQIECSFLPGHSFIVVAYTSGSVERYRAANSARK
jgi:hypothetical protein